LPVWLIQSLEDFAEVIANSRAKHVQDVAAVHCGVHVLLLFLLALDSGVDVDADLHQKLQQGVQIHIVAEFDPLQTIHILLGDASGLV